MLSQLTSCGRLCWVVFFFPSYDIFQVKGATGNIEFEIDASKNGLEFRYRFYSR